MKKLSLFLAALCALFLWSCGNKQEQPDGNAIKLGTAKLSVNISVFGNATAFNVDSMLNTIQIYGATKSIFSTEDEEQNILLTRDNNIYSGDIPVERQKEIGGIRIYINGHFAGGSHVILDQENPTIVDMDMSTDGTVTDVFANDMGISDWGNIAGVAQGAISLYLTAPLFYQSNDELHRSWKKMQSYRVDSIWPKYLKEAIGEYTIPAEANDWMVNNIKTVFASGCILPYTKLAAFNNIVVEEPPMEAYTFLDSIDYSPDVFLKTNMLISPRSFLTQILDYPCGGFDKIGDMPVDQWEDMVSRKLEPAMKTRPKLLLDLLAGMSYIQQIDDNTPLTDTQKENIEKGFTDDLGKIVLARNDRMLAMKNDDVSLRDLTRQKFTLKEYLDTNYAGKPVVVDMWNTWCAPCLNAISQTEEIKHNLADTDLVFLYVSDESSKYNEWKKRAAKIGGEQVRISQDTSTALLENFGLTGFPSYLFFDRDHTLVHAQTSFPGVSRYSELLDEICR